MKNKILKAKSHRKFFALSLALLLVISLSLSLHSSVGQKVERLRIQSEKRIQKLPADSSATISSRQGKLKVLGLVSTSVSDKNYSAEKILVKFRPQLSLQSVDSILKAYNARPERLIPELTFMSSG